ncbi:MAG TPA: hypothetical protein EYG73_06260 [Arcobacter sp.]|nr:hypothetical protein [Arcobacter sp.]
MKKILLSALLFMGVATTSQASCSGDTCTNVTIDSLFAMSNGTILIYTSGQETALNCTSDSVGFVTIDPVASGKNAIYSLLLTASTTNTPVSIRVVNGSPMCRIAYVYN